MMPLQVLIILTIMKIMRTIKFRVWDGKKYISFDNHQYDLIFNDISGWNVAPNIPNFKTEWICGESQSKTPEFTLEQFTGLTDKNGKEIYENDLVKSNGDERVYQVKYSDKDASFVLMYNGGIIVYNINASILEILGNIHENPELL